MQSLAAARRRPAAIGRRAVHNWTKPFARAVLRSAGGNAPVGATATRRYIWSIGVDPEATSPGAPTIENRSLVRV